MPIARLIITEAAIRMCNVFARVAVVVAEAVRNFRLILYCSQRLRSLLDERLRRSGLTVQ